LLDWLWIGWSVHDGSRQKTVLAISPCSNGVENHSMQPMLSPHAF
jgi:hypothetical protein